jgi:NAD(P)-dependent dehydrogenase (short-subunit alcohol dehydrogenase family)
MTLLTGKVALVTGAGGGLGRAHALLLAKEGAAVVVNDLGGLRDGSGGGSSMADKVVAEIKAAGGRAVADHGSVTRVTDAQAMVQRAVDAFGKLDICICNAGILRDKTFKNMTDEMWDAVIDVHLRGTFLVTKAAFDRMTAQGAGGRIVVTSSTTGLFGNFGQTNYGAAKAGIAGFMRCLALESSKVGVTVNALAPIAWSRMTEDLMPHGQGLEEQLAPEKVSPAIVWLCSDEAKEVNGRTFLIGGNSVQLLSWQAHELASRPNDAPPWEPAEVGRIMAESIAKWPKTGRPVTQKIQVVS